MPRIAATALVGALLVTGCGATPVPTNESHDEHVAETSEAPGTPHPSAPQGADGSIELEADFVLGGTGVSVADAIEAASSQPVLVTGILLRESNGAIWFCDAVEQGDPPTCGRPRLWVTNLPSDEAVFASENAANTGARTSDGVTWVADQQLFGIVHLAR